MSEEKTENRKDWTDRLISACASGRLTLALLAAIVIFSLLGIWGVFGLSDVYRSRPFSLLLGLLFINLLVCTLDRLPGIWRTIRLDSGPEAPPPPREPDYRLRLKIGNPEEVLKRAVKTAFGNARILRRTMELKTKSAPASPPAEQVKEGAEPSRADLLVAFHASGKWSRMGPTVTHFGFLILLAGGILGSRWSQTGYLELKPGEAADKYSLLREGIALGQMPLGFTIRCNDFKVTFYSNSAMPSDYLCDLSILDHGVEKVRKVIEVNKPLYYGGFGIYQSSYGTYYPPDRPALRLTATAVSDGHTVGADLKLNEPWTVPGSTVSFQVLDFKEHTSGMGQDLGPSISVRKLIGQNCGRQPCQPAETFKLFERFPAFDAERQDRFHLQFRAFAGNYYTGLSLIRDPGIPLVWTGCALLIVGVMLSFFLFHRRIWITLRRLPAGTLELALLGRTPKARGMFQKHLEEIAARLEAEFHGERV